MIFLKGGFRMSFKQSIAAFFLICGFSLSIGAAVTYDSIYWAPPLDVQGTKIINAKGYVVQLKGFATMDPTGVTKAQIVHFRNDWHITILRMPLEVDGAGNCWRTSGIVVNAPYLAAADSVLKWCEENHIYVLFDGWHESGQGNTIGNFSQTVQAWSIMANRYKNQDHIMWEIFNEPHTYSGGPTLTWATWVPMAQQLIDTIRSKNPVSKVIVAGTINWCQQADVQTLKIARDKIVYSWHPYSNVYGSIGATTWESKFGYIMTSGVAPIMNTEWGFTSASDSAGYGTELIQYMKTKGICWTGWIFSSSWTPQMLTSLNAAAATEVRNPSGNLMFNAYHDTMPVTLVTSVKQQAAGPISGENISVNRSTIHFSCAETSPVNLSIYALNGQCVGTLVDRVLAKGGHSIALNDKTGVGMNLTPGLYTVRLKIRDDEYHAQLNLVK